jgi:site-specific DNA-cytosine methylase
VAGCARREQIRLLGNSVVPQCAEVVGGVIRELAGEVAA